MLYRCREFPDDLLARFPVLPRKRGSRSGKHKRQYLDCVCAFDIETTRISEDYSVMYIWQLQVDLDVTIIGRTWKEFLITCRRLREQLPEGVRLVWLVHNLAFEWQFLRGIYNFKPEEVFLVKSRKPLRVDRWDQIEIRCSYLHSNMRLETYLEKMGVPDKKLSYDYEKKRFPWTQLSDEELAYCINDVKGLVEAYKIEMQHDGDDLYTVPYTSTGYVRRDVKKVMYKYRGRIRDTLPNMDIYDLLRCAFRGGDTHANRFYSGQILENVHSYDRSSSYPDVQVNRLFPVSKFMKVKPDKCTFERALWLKDERHRATLGRYVFWGLDLSDPREGFPYLSTDKCQRLRGEIVDNGRILYAEYVEIVLTDIDLGIVLSQYTSRSRAVRDLYFARYGPLPDDLKELICMYYRLKTELKGIPGSEILMVKAKNKLNSIYGMSATNPVKRSILYKKGNVDKTGRRNEFPEEERSLEEILEKSNEKAFFPYQWGVWTTALAREELFRGRKNVTDQGGIPVYQDTDSIKYMERTGPVSWDGINSEYMEASRRNGAFATDPKGKVHYMGVFEPDKGYPARFATRGAKKYAVQHSDGTIEATISGVSKRDDGGRISGGMELAARGGLEAFLEDHFIFTAAGGVELRYNDHKRFMIRIDGHRLRIRECVTINPSTYDLHDQPEYEDLLESARKQDPAFSAEEASIYMRHTFGKNL